MIKVFIVGSGPFGVSIADLIRSSAQFRAKEIELFGIIDSRYEHLKKAKDVLSSIFSLSYLTPDEFNFSNKDFKLVFGISDPIFKQSFVKQHNLNSSDFYRITRNVEDSDTSDFGNSFLNECGISTCCKIGDYCFIDKNTIIGHNTVIGDFSHIGVGVIIGGDVEIGDGTVIHSGAIISNNIKIGAGATIGAGAVVMRDVPSNRKLIALPSKLL